MNTITEMKITLEGINIRSDEGEDQTSDLEDEVVENTQLKEQKEPPQMRLV